MSYFGMFGNVRSFGKGGSRDKNSQTDFDFDDAVTDGSNIGIRVDPRPSNKRQFKSDKTRSITPDIDNPEKMMMAERVFYGQADADEQWNVQTVNSAGNEDVETKVGEKEPQRTDPCDPCAKYKKCMQKCMSQDDREVKAEPIEEDKREGKEERAGRKQCNDPCRSSSRGREEKKQTVKTEKPRRQCSDLCRVTKKREEQPEQADDTFKDPCADPCQKKDPCADACRDPCFDQDQHELCDDPCVRKDPCNDPCRKKRKRADRCPDPCYDPCRDPCRNPCMDPCREQCPAEDSCEEPSDLPEDPKSEESPGAGAVEAQDAPAPDGEAEKETKAETHNKEVCVTCPPCPPCPPCPQCPECPQCPQCPPCPTSPSTPSNKSYPSCNKNTSGSSNDRFLVQQVKEQQEPTAEKLPAEEEKAACPDPLFPKCKSNEEPCESIVCPEED